MKHIIFNSLLFLGSFLSISVTPPIQTVNQYHYAIKINKSQKAIDKLNYQFDLGSIKVSRL